MSRSSDDRAASVEEVLAIADALERAAAARYAKLADNMWQIGHRDLAATFRALAAEEQHHIDGVQRLLRGKPPSSAPADLHRWVLPATFGIEESGPAALLTPYKALSIAVRAEERAFSFWTYVASTAQDESVRVQAEEMARQELAHAAKLRHARRRAYREEHPYGRRKPESRSYPDVTAVRPELRRLEARVHVPLSEIARRLESVPDAESARLLHDSIVELIGAEPSPARVTHADVAYRIHCAAASGSAGLLFEAVGLLERIVESGLDMLNDTADTAAVAEVQNWLDRAVRIVSRLNARLYALEPSLAEIAADPGQPASVR